MNQEKSELILIIKNVANLIKNYFLNVINDKVFVNSIELNLVDFNIKLESMTKKEEKQYIEITMAILLQNFIASYDLSENLTIIFSNEYVDFMNKINSLKVKMQDVKNDSKFENNFSNFNKTLNSEELLIKKKQTRSNYSKNVSKILKAWLKKNINSPYPSEAEKIELSDLTGLDQTQINNWFINARRRLLPMFKSQRQ